MIKTVMFDLDGTLIPFEQDDFIKAYFGELCRKLAPLGYEPKKTVSDVWSGTAAMIKNDGSRTNCEAFWETFRALNPDLPDAKQLCDEFYTHEFDRAKSCLKYSADRKPIIDELKAAGFTVILATNPIFPLDGVKTRLSWVGLSEEDFALVTHYENSRFCKPNPKYFSEILEQTGALAEECLMIGNSVPEDITASKAVGMSAFLVTDHLENPADTDYSDTKHGSFDDLCDYLRGELICPK